MAEICSFRDLDAWKFGIQLVVTVYKLVTKLPDSERFGLVSQMRRAAVSVPSNVAEGQANGPGGRYRHHVRIALGSWAELVTHLEVIKVLGLLAPSTWLTSKATSNEQVSSCTDSIVRCGGDRSRAAP